jgi:hypothetical protein
MILTNDDRSQKRAESGFHDMNPSTDEDEMASSDSHENDDDEDDDDEDDSDPTAQRERIRRNHVWAIISLLEEQAKGPYHLMVSTAKQNKQKMNGPKRVKVLGKITIAQWCCCCCYSGGVTHKTLIGFCLFFSLLLFSLVTVVTNGGQYGFH